MRRWLTLLVTMTLVGGCATSDGPSPSTTPPAATTTTILAPALPSYFRFGPDGLHAGQPDGTERLLVGEPVRWAASDRLGGVIFEYSSDARKTGTYRVTAGSTEPEPLSGNRGFTGLVDGRPVYAWLVWGRSQDAAQAVALHGVDLATAEEWEISGSFGSMGEDWIAAPDSLASDLAVGISSGTVGTCSSTEAIHFWSIGLGDPIVHDHNPQPESCDPCELSARLSPDGDLLAWWKVPTAHWPGPDCDFIERVDFWESVADVPASVSVVDLSDGTVLWSTEVGNQDRLVDFDGRWLVTGPWLPLDPERSLVYDTHGSTEPVAEIPGRIILNQNLEEDP